MQQKKWFETWFNSPYYHILYKERNQREAEFFLDNLVTFLKPALGARILDVACGKGRHSIYLSKKGFEVTGFDLSIESILHDKQFETVNLDFYVHDMREVFRVNYFDIILNLFSSFGYFEREQDNIRCIQSSAQALKRNGYFVFDYFNAEKVRQSGNQSMEKTVDKIHFAIRKSILKNMVCKEISFSDAGKNFVFEERVLLLSLNELEHYFKKAGLVILHTFGNYKLDPFIENKSDRIILIARKI